jgi:hypothetical protein
MVRAVKWYGYAGTSPSTPDGKPLFKKGKFHFFPFSFRDTDARPCERSYGKADFPSRGLAMASEYGSIPVP